MSETYVVFVIRYERGKQYAIRSGEKIMNVEFTCDNWTTEPQQRKWARDAAESCFYALAELFVEHEVERNLVLTGHSSRPEVYSGSYTVEDESENVQYYVGVFRHYEEV